MFSDQTARRFREAQRILDQLDQRASPQACIMPGSPEPQGDIIVFPGSFNPTTTAHLALLEQARRFGSQHGGMLVYAAISKRTTDKEAVTRPLLVDRILLLDTVVHNHLLHTGVLLFNRGLYVEQAEAIHTAFPTVRHLFFLLGFDKIVQIFDAHYYADRDKALRELFVLAEILVAPRAGAGAAELTSLLDRPENAPFAMYIHILPFDASYRDISSSRIRQDVAMHLQEMPSEVQQFIRETDAYTPPTRLPDGSIVDRYGERMKNIEQIIHSSGER